MNCKDRTSHLRPLLDELVWPADPPVIVLRHLEGYLYTALATEKPSGRGIRYVSKRIPEGLVILHDHNYMHTD